MEELIILAMSDFLQKPNLKELVIPLNLAFIGALVASYVSLKWFMGILTTALIKDSR